MFQKYTWNTYCASSPMTTSSSKKSHMYAASGARSLAPGRRGHHLGDGLDWVRDLGRGGWCILLENLLEVEVHPLELLTDVVVLHQVLLDIFPDYAFHLRQVFG